MERTDTERLNWLVAQGAYSFVDPDHYGPEWFTRDRFAMVREEIDAAMIGTEAEVAETEETT